MVVNMRPSISPGDAEPLSDLANTDFLHGFISEQEYARRRGVTLRTCQRDRQLRKAPPYVKLGRNILYRVDAVRAWLVKNECSDVRRPAPRPRTRLASSYAPERYPENSPITVEREVANES